MPQRTPLTGRHIVLCPYQQVHGRRVVRDDVQARHLLLHADGRPRLIDFEGSWRPTEAQMRGPGRGIGGCEEQAASQIGHGNCQTAATVASVDMSEPGKHRHNRWRRGVGVAMDEMLHHGVIAQVPYRCSHVVARRRCQLWGLSPVGLVLGTLAHAGHGYWLHT